MINKNHFVGGRVYRKDLVFAFFVLSIWGWVEEHTHTHTHTHTHMHTPRIPVLNPFI